MNQDVMIDETGQPLLLRGCALPYGARIEVDGAPERFEFGAFKKQRGKGFPAIAIQWQHDTEAVAVASTDDGSLCLFDTVFGLLFEANLYAIPASLGLLQVARSAGLGCSIEFTGDYAAKSDGTVQAAHLNHIGLSVAGETCYATTRAWVEDSSTRYDIHALGPDILAWRRHLESHLRRLEMDEREAQQARKRKPKPIKPTPRAGVLGNALTSSLKRSRARMRVTAR